MSYDLHVFVRSLPGDLRGAWQDALARSGLVTLIHPDFDPEKQDGYLAWSLQVANPDAFRFASQYPATAVEAGFELEVHPAEIDDDEWKTASPAVLDKLDEAERTWTFRAAHHGKPADFRLFWFAAATLAELTDGVLQDPQEDRSFTGKEALAEAEFQADRFEEEQRDEWQASTAFDGW
jgi:hypothetical protein